MDSTLNLLISSLAALITATATGLITAKKQIDLEKLKVIVAPILKEHEKGNLSLDETLAKIEGALQPITGIKRWGIILGVGIATGLIFLAALWLLSLLGRDPATTHEALTDNFETDIAPEWRIQEGQASLSQSTDYAFAGRHALRVDVSLAERTNQRDKVGTVELVLEGRQLRNRIVVVRVYAPEGVPSNLFAGLFINDAAGQWRSGSGRMLSAGQWTTLVWSTRDVLTWQSPAKLGLQFTLTPGRLGTDQRAYQGPLYLDLVELLTLPTNVGGPSLDHILKPLVFYDFEGVATVPSNITPVGYTQGQPGLADDVSWLGGHNAMQLDVDLLPYSYTIESGYAGIYVDLAADKPLVDAMSVSVLLPKQNDTQEGNFEVSFVALDAKGNQVYSGGLPIQVGEWTPYFWGTRYVFSGHGFCEDADRDSQCDDQSESYVWYSWKETNLSGFELRILRHDGGYSGPVYFDNLAVYQVGR